MPLLDHFHPPLHGPRRWEGFHHAWATFIAQQLNQQTLPPGYFAESEMSVGPELEIDVAAMQDRSDSDGPANAKPDGGAVPVWSPPRPAITAQVQFSHLEGYEVRVYQDLGGAQLRAAIDLVSPTAGDGPAGAVARGVAGDTGAGRAAAGDAAVAGAGPVRPAPAGGKLSGHV